MYGLKVNLTNVSNFDPLKVVDRGGETQLRVGESSSFILFSGLRVKEPPGYYWSILIW